MTIAATQSPPTWDSLALLAKSQLYIEKMFSCSREDWDFGLWSNLALELLARAALAKVSPILLADQKDWSHLYHALGNPPVTAKYVPKSITITETFNRLKTILPEFNSDHEKFCIQHMSMRNAELHSGDAPFQGEKPSLWISSFYNTCSVLVNFLGHDLTFLLGKEEAEIATKMIAAANDQAAKAVNGTVKSYQTVWEGKPQVEKDTLSSQATILATRGIGHRVKCPACKSDSIVNGEPFGVPKQTVEFEIVTEKQEHLPNKFQCTACGLKILGLAQLVVCNLGSTYTKTMTYTLAELYEPEDPMEEWGDDNNEYY